MVSPILSASSAGCNFPQPLPQLLEQWNRLYRDWGVERATLDSRLGHEAQAELLALLGAQGTRCRLLEHPVRGDGGRAAPAAASPDPDERRAASQQLLRSARRAAEGQVPKLALLPSWIALSTGPDQLVQAYQRGADPELLAAERRQRGARALDGLCLVLDPLLGRLGQLELELVLPLPTPLPHMVPNAAEAAELQQRFAGAPLRLALALDWWHAAQELGALEQPAALPPAQQLWLADACGVATGLPPGLGELDWELGREALGESLPEEVVLTVEARHNPQPAELAHLGASVLRWVEGLGAQRDGDGVGATRG